MKKLMAAASYSFNNFYNNLNAEGQIIFSIIVFLIIILCVLLLISYIVQHIKDKKAINSFIDNSEVKDNEKENKIEESIKRVELKEENNLYTEERTEIEDIASRVSEALKEDMPINLTTFEEDQEKTAIISIDELIKRAKELELIDDEEKTSINYLEKYNLEPAEVNNVIDNTMKKEKEVKAFRVSQVISPIYGVKKEAINNNENEGY